jgi:hypothetical protein
MSTIRMTKKEIIVLLEVPGMLDGGCGKVSKFRK